MRSQTIMSCQKSKVSYSSFSRSSGTQDRFSFKIAQSLSFDISTASFLKLYLKVILQESDYAHSQQRHTEPVSNEKEFYREYLTRDLLGMQRSRPPHGAAWDCGGYHFCSEKGVNVKSCQVIYSQFGLAIHQNDHQARRRFVEWAQNEIAVVPDYHKRILFSDEAHFWLNGYVNKQNCRIWSEANPQVYVETPLHPKKLTVWCALWAGGILQKR
ncbi:hypothetical protein TNCV_955521 [Trichonephila clavipes]|nr:hypothetical protein TNCV_955521 [Trichonephila clavipes]